VGLHRLRTALDEVAVDPRARGLFVTLRSVGGGAARLRSLRERLAALRAQGKVVIVHLPDGAALRELAVASAATAVWLDPAAHIAPLGVSVGVPYIKDALQKAGVTADVFARGRYKTAAEGFMRSAMSDAQREQLSALVDELFDDAVHAIVEGRGVPRERVVAWIEQSPWAAVDAVEHGLVDTLVTDQEVNARLLAWPNEPEPREHSPRPERDEPAPVGIGTYLARRRFEYRPFRPRPYLAVVDVHGAIVTEAQTSAVVAAEDSLTELFEEIRRDKRARAVVLHIDSRGGSALASARILRAVLAVRAEKPVVAYFSDAAASGGYMIGVGATRIVSQPVTLTGSIGVVAAKPVFAELLAKLGVSIQVVKRGERVDMFSPTRSLDAGERAAFERELEVTYSDFIRVVSRGRGHSEDAIREVAEGRVWSGRAAFGRGLVDRLGGFEVALEEARALVGAGAESLEPRRVSAPRLRAAPLRVPRLLGATRALWGERIPTGHAAHAFELLAARWWGRAGELLEERLCLEPERLLAYCDVVVDPQAGEPL
jgi:protease-4